MPRCARAWTPPPTSPVPASRNWRRTTKDSVPSGSETTWRSTRRPTRPRRRRGSGALDQCERRALRFLPRFPARAGRATQGQARRGRTRARQQPVRYQSGPACTRNGPTLPARGGRSLAALAGLLPAHGSAHRQRVARRPGFSSEAPDPLPAKHRIRSDRQGLLRDRLGGHQQDESGIDRERRHDRRDDARHAGFELRIDCPLLQRT